jgi:hypothetical protein
MARKRRAEMTPELRIRREMLQDAMDEERTARVPLDEPGQVEAAWEAARDEDWVGDAESEFREGRVETGLECDSDRHYESRSVARRMRDGTWVGWTFWFGGGKHGQPGEVPWAEDAYLLEVTEEMRPVQVFRRARG